MEIGLTKRAIKSKYLSLMGIEDSILARLFISVNLSHGAVLVHEVLSSNVFIACVEGAEIVGFSSLSEVAEQN